MKVFTQEEIDRYAKEDEEAYHHFYKKAKEIAEEMKVHADGCFPEALLKERRPHEPQVVMDYRQKIWVPITKPTFSKVFQSLQKIRRSSDWIIKYGDLGEFTKINETETLEQYCEKNFPYFTSVTNWVFSLLLRKYLIDPNAVVLVLPLETDILENEFIRPFPVVFSSEDVIDYRADEFAVLRNPLGATYYVGGKEFDGKSFYAVTEERILRYDQINGRGDMNLALDYEHGLTILPCFSLKGILVDQVDNQFLYESRLAGMIPELDEAIREYSDLQAAKVLHIYPERWEYTNNECTNCKGTGKRRNPMWFEGCGSEIESQVNCDTCEGRGYVNAGPYSKIMIRPVNPAIESGSQIPNPPAGYIEKDVEIIKVMEAGIERHIYNALAANNFEFLSKTPLSESGVAKEVDKDELNTSVHSVAEDIVACMDSLYKIVAYYRYKTLYSFDDINEMLPSIPVPEKFDILSPQHKEEELTKAKQNKTNPNILNALEIDYAGTRFFTEPDIRNMLVLILELDPLANISEEDKMTRLSNGGITKETYIISSNIQEFIQRAVEENEGFSDKTLKEQKDILKKYATDQLNSALVVAMPEEEEIINAG